MLLARPRSPEHNQNSGEQCNAWNRQYTQECNNRLHTPAQGDRDSSKELRCKQHMVIAAKYRGKEIGLMVPRRRVAASMAFQSQIQLLLGKQVPCIGKS